MAASRTGKLAGRVALVTGASGGIGRAVAAALHGAHAKVAMTDLPETGLEEAVSAVNGRIKRADRLARGYALDVSDEMAVERAVRRVMDDFHTITIDILVTCAGIAPSGPLAKMEQRDWDRTLAVNLTGSYFAARAVLPGMLEAGWGRIVHIASSAGLQGYAYTSAYSASKHGIVGLTRAASLELEGTGVAMAAICPGFVDSPMTDASVARIVAKTGMTERKARSALAKQNPSGRLVKPASVAAKALAAVKSPSSNGRIASIG